MTTKKICVTAMGVALFVVLALCLQVPVFENYYLCLGYVPMMVFCWYFGPVSGMTVGTLGVIVYCLLTNGLRGMPGWVAGNLVIGLLVGLACRIPRGKWTPLIVGGAILISTAVGILGVKSFVEVILYAQPMVLRMAKNLYAFVADVVVLFAAVPVCVSLENVVRKRFPEEKMCQ